MSLEILYEDNHLLVLNKPPGLLTQPSGTDHNSLEDEAKAWIKEKHEKKGNVYLHAVHRLDRPASGIVLFARTSKALSRLNELVRKKKFRKIYHALVEGLMPKPEGTLEHELIHEKHQARVVSSGGKLARLHYRCLKKVGNYTLIEIDLETGRYHQIRAQLSAVGCPILGDKKYGSKAAFDEGIALHHYRLEFAHPVSGEVVQIQAAYPSTWPII